MADEIDEIQETETKEAVTRTPQGEVRQTTTATNAPGRRYSVAEQVIALLTTALLALLAVRVVLSLLGANRGNAFAAFIYGLSYPFVAPFFGLFGYTPQYGVARLELETLVAIVVYAIVGYGIARLVGVGRRA